jgi:hypothetical protein
VAGSDLDSETGPNLVEAIVYRLARPMLDLLLVSAESVAAAAELIDSTGGGGRALDRATSIINRERGRILESQSIATIHSIRDRVVAPGGTPLDTHGPPLRNG